MKKSRNLINILTIFIVLGSVFVFGNYTFRKIQYKKNIDFNRNYLENSSVCPSKLDINNDGLVNDGDSEYLSNLIKEQEDIDLEYDYNNDSVVDSKDLLILIKCINISNNYDCPLSMDLNGDSFIDDKDTQYLSDLITNNEEIDTSYDYNNDGVVNTKDLSKLSLCINEYNTFVIGVSDDNLVNDNELKIIGNIDSGIKVSEFVSLVDTDGDIVINDKDNNLKTNDMIIMTGDKLVVTNDRGNTVIYSLSVRGDVLGTGIPSKEDVKTIASHIIDGNVILGNEYLMAGDIDQDGKIKMNDAMRILKSITNNS